MHKLTGMNNKDNEILQTSISFASMHYFQSASPITHAKLSCMAWHGVEQALKHTRGILGWMQKQEKSVCEVEGRVLGNGGTYISIIHDIICWLIYKKCHPKRYHIKCHMTINIIFSALH